MNPVVALALAGQNRAAKDERTSAAVSQRGKERVAAPQTAGTQAAEPTQKLRHF
jgi:hypothetical protein